MNELSKMPIAFHSSCHASTEISGMVTEFVQYEHNYSNMYSCPFDPQIGDKNISQKS